LLDGLRAFRRVLFVLNLEARLLTLDDEKGPTLFYLIVLQAVARVSCTTEARDDAALELATIRAAA